MQFNLNYIPPKPGFEIMHSQKVFLIGSCFSENIGDRLKDYKFKIYSNPSGILFNPLSIHKCLDNIIHQKQMDRKYIIDRNNISLSFLHHSSVHDFDEDDLIKKINSENKKALQFLKEAAYMVITLGSAFAYHHIKLNEVVANCHKQPGAGFEKKIIKPDQFVAMYSDLITQLKNINPGLRFIFTVSPVKYLKDGLVENNLSKATLLLGVHELMKQQEACYYFPAYELVNDDLRDYRFYKEDQAHPNNTAINYVWEKFSDCYFSAKTRLLNNEVGKLNAALNHRKLIANSEEALKLNDYIIKQKEIIKNLNPGIEL